MVVTVAVVVIVLLTVEVSPGWVVNTMVVTLPEPLPLVVIGDVVTTVVAPAVVVVVSTAVVLAVSSEHTLHARLHRELTTFPYESCVQNALASRNVHVNTLPVESFSPVFNMSKQPQDAHD